MNYTSDYVAPFSGPACWPLLSFSDSLRAGFSASVSVSLRHCRGAFTSPANRPAQTSWSFARKEQRPPFPSAVNIALRGLALMAERLFSNPPLHFRATWWR